MPMGVKIAGFAEMQAELKALGDAVRIGAVRDAAKEAAAVMRDEMRERAPVLDEKTAESTALAPGELKRGIGLWLRSAGEGLVMVIIGPRRGTGRAAHLVEYGHRLVKGGASRVGARGAEGPGREIGDVPAHPFLRPAFEASSQKVLDKFAEALRERLRKWLS